MKSELVSLRQRQGLTQAELAELAGISRQQLIALERGYIPRWGASLELVAAALGVTVEQLKAGLERASS